MPTTWTCSPECSSGSRTVRRCRFRTGRFAGGQVIAEAGWPALDTASHSATDLGVASFNVLTPWSGITYGYNPCAEDSRRGADDWTGPPPLFRYEYRSIDTGVFPEVVRGSDGGIAVAANRIDEDERGVWVFAPSGDVEYSETATGGSANGVLFDSTGSLYVFGSAPTSTGRVVPWATRADYIGGSYLTTSSWSYASPSAKPAYSGALLRGVLCSDESTLHVVGRESHLIDLSQNLLVLGFDIVGAFTVLEATQILGGAVVGDRVALHANGVDELIIGSSVVVRQNRDFWGFVLGYASAGPPQRLPVTADMAVLEPRSMPDGSIAVAADVGPESFARLYTVAGRQVARARFEGAGPRRRATLPVVPTGVYFVHVDSPGGTLAGKVLHLVPR